MTGSRADLIIADDIETPINTMTQGMRDRLSETVKEFESIKPMVKFVFLVRLNASKVYTNAYQSVAI